MRNTSCGWTKLRAKKSLVGAQISFRILSPVIPFAGPIAFDSCESQQKLNSSICGLSRTKIIRFNGIEMDESLRLSRMLKPCLPLSKYSNPRFLHSTSPTHWSGHRVKTFGLSDKPTTASLKSWCVKVSHCLGSCFMFVSVIASVANLILSDPGRCATQSSSGGALLLIAFQSFDFFVDVRDWRCSIQSGIQAFCWVVFSQPGGTSCHIGYMFASWSRRTWSSKSAIFIARS